MVLLCQSIIVVVCAFAHLTQLRLDTPKTKQSKPDCQRVPRIQHGCVQLQMHQRHGHVRGRSAGGGRLHCAGHAARHHPQASGEGKDSFSRSNDILIKVFFCIFLKEIPFVNGTEAYDRWEKLSVPMSYSYYFFQPINPEVFLTSPESVEYEELGPFVFEENFTKIDAQFEDDETRVVYKEERTYAFQEHLSVPNITMDSEIYMFIGFMFGFGFQKQTLSGVLQQIMVRLDVVL